MIDFYDLLQISPNAEVETIHRVYHFLAARYHPDNQKSGDSGIFQMLKTAHDVLSDPARRVEYDAMRKQGETKPLSASVDFLDNLDGELNRRMAVLVVLYYQRRKSPHTPELSLKEIEVRMGFPRDYLDFTLWYLNKKNFITRADNAQYEMTVEGVDFVETERSRLPVLQRLLTSSADSSTENLPEAFDAGHTHEPGINPAGPGNHAPVSTPIILNASIDPLSKLWEGKRDRRIGAPDFRPIKTERRKSVGPRPVGANDLIRPN